MTTDPIVEELVVLRGREPFDAFFRREIRPLIGLAYALSGSAIAAEDIAQEAMLAAYRRWDHVARLDQPGAWVRRVVANQAVSTLRRRVAEAKSLARLAVHRQPVSAPELPADGEWVWAAVRRLPRRQAQVVALHYYDQLSMPEIARILGCSKESVNTHLRRARATLERRLYRGGMA